MHLKRITVKGFKSFPDRTKLEFSPGVSVVVGPNGSGKSNITDAVLWALGEQSPLAVRGQTMQDVIFTGGSGLKPRKSAEVEVVIDNSDGALGTEFSELSIVRRLDRSGEGQYRLNGARCRRGPHGGGGGGGSDRRGRAAPRGGGGGVRRAQPRARGAIERPVRRPLGGRADRPAPGARPRGRLVGRGRAGRRARGARPP